eukprot:365622-Chlamydomonas_euryale.AAC.11
MFAHCCAVARGHMLGGGGATGRIGWLALPCVHTGSAPRVIPEACGAPLRRSAVPQPQRPTPCSHHTVRKAEASFAKVARQVASEAHLRQLRGVAASAATPWDKLSQAAIPSAQAAFQCRTALREQLLNIPGGRQMVEVQANMLASLSVLSAAPACSPGRRLGGLLAASCAAADAARFAPHLCVCGLGVLPWPRPLLLLARVAAMLLGGMPPVVHALPHAPHALDFLRMDVWPLRCLLPPHLALHLSRLSIPSPPLFLLRLSILGLPLPVARLSVLGPALPPLVALHGLLLRPCVHTCMFLLLMPSLLGRRCACPQGWLPHPPPLLPHIRHAHEAEHDACVVLLVLLGLVPLMALARWLRRANPLDTRRDGRGTAGNGFPSAAAAAAHAWILVAGLVADSPRPLCSGWHRCGCALAAPGGARAT